MSRRAQLLVAAVVSTVALSLAPAPAANAAVTITINGAASGRQFDGVGAVSGGGGTSRLLPDYPAQQQSEVLDYLFKPGFGAALQILKVEIGGDTNSTNGAEASHMRTASDLNCDRGYEWWLMQQAKARNPNIKLAALSWGAPGWLGGGNFFSQDTIDYLIKWLDCAAAKGLTIDYMGGQNEAGYSKSWLQSFKSALLAKYPSTKLIGGDEVGGAWGIVDDMTNDAAFRNAIDVAGVHYPCGHMSPADNCSPPNSNPINLNKPVWSSEDGSQHFDTGAPPLARAINRNYIDGRMTATINWNAVGSVYTSLPYAGDSLMEADSPWSGTYQVGKSIWVTAHTTQFTQPGWRYLDSATGYLGGVRNNGSYVALKSPNGRDYSTIVETTKATTAQTATFNVTGGLSTGTVHVWATNLNSSNPANFFVHTTDVTPVGGSYTLTLQPGYVYSITTTTGQGKGITTPPADRGIALPYRENFDSYPTGSLVKYFADVAGGFDTSTCAAGRAGRCLRQQINIAPIEWPLGSSSPPVTVAGDPAWSNYQVSVDALLEQSGSLDLIGRSNGVSQFGGGSPGYHLRITSAGRWSLFRQDDNARDTVLASGSRAIGVNTWHTLALNLNGANIQATIDGTAVASVTDSQWRSGHVGLLVSKWKRAQFDNFSVTAPGGQPGPEVITVDDSASGTGPNKFNYAGDWQHCTDCGDELYGKSNSWDATTGDTVTVAFTGTRIAFYGVVDPQHGIGAVSVDGGTEATVDFYAANRTGDRLLWTSPVLANGNHTFRLRVTGTRNPHSSATYVVPDRVNITTAGSPTG
jgi:O-glycosyl hydrolase